MVSGATVSLVRAATCVSWTWTSALANRMLVLQMIHDRTKMMLDQVRRCVLMVDVVRIYITLATGVIVRQAGRVSISKFVRLLLIMATWSLALISLLQSLLSKSHYLAQTTNRNNPISSCCMLYDTVIHHHHQYKRRTSQIALI